MSDPRTLRRVFQLVYICQVAFAGVNRDRHVVC